MGTNPSGDTGAPCCPWCGESDVLGASAQIERVGTDEWLCNTCSRVFTVSRHAIPLDQRHVSPQGDGDDGLGDREVTEEDERRRPSR